MNLQRISLFVLLIAVGLQSSAQSESLAKITVNSGLYERENSIVSIHLENHHLKLEDGEFALLEVSGKQTKAVNAQLDLSKGVVLWWVLDGKTKAKTKRTYELRRQKKPAKVDPEVKILKDDKVLKVQVNGKNALQYNYATVMPPEGVAPIYQRSGFIHPLWSPKGEVITRIQPPDHYHHVGLWNPWTHTEYSGREIDFWNLVKAQGTVKFSTFLSTSSNDLYGGFRAIHDHVDLNAQTPDGSKVVLNEEWDVRVWNISDSADPAWVIDFTSTFNCATDSALTLKEYRYQGFGLRATEKWDDNTATILTSEGLDKGTGNATRARWCDVNGISDFGTSGILFMTHPTNYNYPEPIRIWPVGANEGKENVFFNFNPTMDRDWVLQPGTDYRLKYRMFVYDGKIEAGKMEKLWSDFAEPPIVTIETK